MRGRLLRAATLAGVISGFLCATHGAAAQDGEQPAGRMQFEGMQRVSGEVTAVTANGLTLKTEDGSTVQVTTTDNTRIMKST